jgi:thioesterase domain-containing protein
LIESYPMPSAAAVDYGDSDRLWHDVAFGAGLALPAGDVGYDAAGIKAIASEQGHVFGAFPLQRLDALARIMANNTRLLPTARLKRFEGEVTLFTAARITPGLDRSAVSPALWRPHVSGKIKVVAIDAEHHTMLSHHAVAQMRGHIK